MWKVKHIPDQSGEAPWDHCDAHGPVSEWTRRDKLPGEMVLCHDRTSQRYYDFEEAMRMAKLEGWDAPPFGEGTQGEQALRAVLADYNTLRRWCDGDWWYATIIVELYHNDTLLGSDSLGMVEYGPYMDHLECVMEMKRNILAEIASGETNYE